jgi:DNA-binding LytR/AlgR family response regulator
VEIKITSNNIVNKEEIIYFKSIDNYTQVKLASGETVVSSKTLGYYESLLTNDIKFVRTHKSYIINLVYIDNLTFNCRGGIVELMNEKIEISRRKVAEFRRTYRYFLKNHGINPIQRIQSSITPWRNE